VGDRRSRLRVMITIDDVADVVQVRGDPGQLALPGRSFQRLDYRLGALRSNTGVTPAVLGVTDRLENAIGTIQVVGDLSVLSNVG
jgi:hypothetical protein